MHSVDLNAELGLFLIKILDGCCGYLYVKTAWRKPLPWVQCAEGGNSWLGLWFLRVLFNFVWIQVSEHAQCCCCCIFFPPQPTQDVNPSFNFLHFLWFSVNPLFRKLVASCRLFVVAAGQLKWGDVYTLKYDETLRKICLALPGWVFFWGIVEVKAHGSGTSLILFTGVWRISDVIVRSFIGEI